jgi:hypothetical protein
MRKINRPIGMGDGHVPIEEQEVCGLPCVLFYVKKFVKKKIISRRAGAQKIWKPMTFLPGFLYSQTHTRANAVELND